MDINSNKRVFNNVMKKTDNFQTNQIIEKIQNEYGLKRRQFNPKKPSPNIFMNKLQKRMNIYYTSLSTHRKILKK